MSAPFMYPQLAYLSELLIQLSMIIMIGIYCIFSNTVMPSLKKLDTGAEVMININRVILNPLFLGVFWVSGLGSLYLLIFAQGTLFFSGAIFLLGTTLVTMVKNVPLNNQLRDAQQEREQVWQHYLDKWVFWNHVRSTSAVISGLLLII